jgi:hypothetical protein
MAKVVVLAILCILGLATFYGIEYASETDEAQRNLDEEKRQSHEIDSGLAFQEKLTAARKEMSALLQASEILTARNEEIRAETVNLEAAQRSVREAYLRAVERVRSDTIGMTMDELALNNGVVLKNVRVQNLSQTEITVLHSEGIGKVSLELLPDHLKSRLRVGMTTFAGLPISVTRTE